MSNSLDRGAEVKTPRSLSEYPAVLLALSAQTIGFFSNIALLFLLAILAIPLGLLSSIWLHRKWKHFRDEYRSRGRLIGWTDLEPKLSEGRGTLIVEEDSQLGFRFWWTEDKLTSQNSPSPLPEKEMFDLTCGKFEERAHPYIDWFQERYLDVHLGRAILVDDAHCHHWKVAKDRSTLENYPGVPIVWTAMTGFDPCRRS